MLNGKLAEKQLDLKLEVYDLAIRKHDSFSETYYWCLCHNREWPLYSIGNHKRLEGQLKLTMGI